MEATPTELAWLAGVFDGEGSARIYRHNGSHFYAQVDACTNTDYVLVAKVSDLLVKIGIRHHVRNNGNDKNARHSPAYSVRITSYSSVRDLLLAILPWVTGQKRHQAELLLSFVRLSRINCGRKKRTDALIAADLELYNKQHFRPHRIMDLRLQ